MKREGKKAFEPVRRIRHLSAGTLVDQLNFVLTRPQGAHLNPAVSLSLCMLGRHPWIKLPFYIFFQVFGAFLGAATVGLQYYGESRLNEGCNHVQCGEGTVTHVSLSCLVWMKVLRLNFCFYMIDVMFADAIRAYSGGELTVTGPTATAGIFSTYPSDYLSVWGGIVDQVRWSQILPSLPLNHCRHMHVTSLLSHGTVIQVIGTAALLLCVLALGDQRNTSIPDGLQPVLVGGVVLGIGVSMGSNSGYAINPARDIGPRLFTYIAGWGADVFRLVLSV